MFCVDRENKRPLEDVLCSKTRWKILKLLVKYGQLNTSEIAEKLGSNYSSTDAHLKLLADEGVLQLRSLGRIRFYRIDAQTETVCAILAVLEQFEQAEN